MGTRGVIAKPLADGWEGRYHHWDSYPTALGATLWAAHHGHFAQSVEAMIEYLIDNEPIGWSTINGYDLALGPCWVESNELPKNADGWADYSKVGPQSYSERGETQDGDGYIRFTGAEGEDFMGAEWAYVLGPREMFVWDVPYRGNPKLVAAVSWDGPEPEWGIIENSTDEDD